MSNVKFEHLPHDVCRVTSKFGYRTNPITAAASSHHQGIDFGAAKAGVQGDKLYAVANGKVVYSADMMSTVYGYGHFIIIEHNGFCVLYAHMREHIMKVNDIVKAGDIVGYMGSTGASTAAHLHFEVEQIQWSGYEDYIAKNAIGVRKYAVDPYVYVKAYRTELINKAEEEEDVTKLEELGKQIAELKVVRYKNINEMPTYYQSSIKDLVNKGIIKGNDTGSLNITEDMVRTIIICGRMNQL